MRISQSPSRVLRGQMWWANIPHDLCNPHAQSGLRPVVVVSNDKGNLHSPSLLVCPLTTQEDKYKFIHPNVMCDGTLSYVQCEQIKVLDKELLSQYIGHVRDIELKYIDRGIATATDLFHYLDKLDKMKIKLAEVNSELENSYKEAKELRLRLAELESEIEQYRSNEDMFELGVHVKGIMNILSNNANSSCSQASEHIDQNIMEVADKLSSQPNNQFNEVNDEPATVPISMIKPSSFSSVSAVEKFNNRYEKYRQLQSDKDGQTKCTPEIIKFHDKLGRPSATKWTDQYIKSFIADYSTLPKDDLLRKYDLRSFATAAKYYHRFINHESL